MRQAGRSILSDADYVVPVPLHRRRLRQRGFNQSLDLAARLGVPVVGALRRPGATPPQTGLPAAARRRNVRDAFASTTRPWIRSVRRPQIEGRVVVLIDDVATTGATLEACARVLLAAGAREVRGLTAARAEVRRFQQSPQQSP
jgi:ComF family protein